MVFMDAAGKDKKISAGLFSKCFQNVVIQKAGSAVEAFVVGQYIHGEGRGIFLKGRAEAGARQAGSQRCLVPRLHASVRRPSLRGRRTGIGRGGVCSQRRLPSEHPLLSATYLYEPG